MPLTAISAQPDLIQNLKAQYDESAFAPFTSAPPAVKPQGIMPFSGIGDLGATLNAADQQRLFQMAIIAASSAYNLKDRTNTAPATLATQVANRFMIMTRPYWSKDISPEAIAGDMTFQKALLAIAPLSTLKSTPAPDGGGKFAMSKTTLLIAGAAVLGLGYWYFVKGKQTY